MQRLTRFNLKAILSCLTSRRSRRVVRMMKNQLELDSSSDVAPFAVSPAMICGTNSREKGTCHEAVTLQRFS
jgi:hypothetical protein